MSSFTQEEVESVYNVPSGVVYLNSAGHCILPRSSQNVGIQQIQAQGRPWNGYGNEEEDSIAVRSMFASLINASSYHSVGMCHSTSFAMSTAAFNILRLGILAHGSKVIVLGQEMGSGVIPWQDACAKSGAELVVVGDGIEASDDHELQQSFDWTQHILKALDDKVKVVCIPNVHWCDGAIVDLHAIALRIHQFPTDIRPLLIIDGTQSIGAMNFDAQIIKPDFVACSIHKWLNGPFGLSLTYLDPKHHNSWVPLDQHDRNRIGCELVPWDCLGGMVQGQGYPLDLYTDGRCIISGGHPNPVTISMLRTSLEIIDRWTTVAIQGHCKRLAQYLEKIIGSSAFVSNLLFTKPSERCCGHIFGIYLNTLNWKSYLAADVDKLAIGLFICSHLKSKGIYTVMRGGCLRISFYLFNTEQHCDLLIDALQEAAELYKLQQVHTTYNILVTGVAGWLGQFVWKALADQPNTSDGRQIKVFGGYNRSLPEWVPEDQRVHLDFTDSAAIDAAIAKVIPDCVIHLAAISAVLGCEQNPQNAYQVNCCQPLVDAVRKTNSKCRFIFSSTDLVYDGERSPYQCPSLCGDSALSTGPVNVYGASKLAMEKLVVSLENGFVLRLSNMIGPAFAYKSAGTKFLQFLLNAYNSKQVIGLKDDEKRSFVYVMDVVRVILKLALSECPSLVNSNSAPHERIFNVGGPVGLSRLELASLLCSTLGGNLRIEGDNTAVVTAEKDWVVQRMASTVPAAGSPNSPRDVTMDSTNTFAKLHLTMTSLVDAIPLCL